MQIFWMKKNQSYGENFQAKKPFYESHHYIPLSRFNLILKLSELS